MTSQTFVRLAPVAALLLLAGCGSNGDAADADPRQIALSDLQYTQAPMVEMCGDALLVRWNPFAPSTGLSFDEFALLDRASGTGQTVRVEAPTDSPWADPPLNAFGEAECVDTASGPLVQVVLSELDLTEGAEQSPRLVAVFDLTGEQLWARDDIQRLDSVGSDDQRSHLSATTSPDATESELIDLNTGETVAELDSELVFETVGADRQVTRSDDGALELQTLAGDRVARLTEPYAIYDVEIVRQDWFAVSLRDSGTLAAYDAESGRRMWTAPIDLGTNTLAGSSSDDDVLAVLDGSGVLHAIDVRTGEELWSERDVTTESVTSPFVGGGVVRVMTSMTEHEYAVFDARTGREIDLGDRTLVDADAQGALIARGEKLSVVPLDRLTSGMG